MTTWLKPQALLPFQLLLMNLRKWHQLDQRLLLHLLLLNYLQYQNFRSLTTCLINRSLLEP